jgi:predicted metal-dependent phosphoesterase TrpH
MINIDFHTHTWHSNDCTMNPAKILRIAHEKGLNAIVINDHNTIKGGLEAKLLNPYHDLEVIVGAEIKTDAGDITGIYLKEEISSKQFADVAREIKSQGGIVILNHPAVDHDLNLIDFKLVDFIEGYNSRLTESQNLLAIELAKKNNKPLIAGSDAHIYADIGKCYTSYQNSDLFKPYSIKYSRCSIRSVPVSQLIKAIKKRDFNLFLRLMAIIPKYVVCFYAKFKVQTIEYKIDNKRMDNVVKL